MFEWWNVILIVLAIVVAIVAVRFSFTFNVNQWLEARRKRQLEQLRNLCTHAEMEQLPDGRISVESRFTSPAGTRLWICNRCQMTTHDQRIANMSVQMWASNPAGWVKQEKRFNKLASKLGLI